MKLLFLGGLTDTPLTNKVRYAAGMALGRHFAPRNFSALFIFFKLSHFEVLLQFLNVFRHRAKNSSARMRVSFKPSKKLGTFEESLWPFLKAVKA